MRLRMPLLAAATAALGLVTAGLTAGAHPAAAAPVHHGYTGSSAEAGADRAFFDAVVRSVAAKRAAHPDAASVTITYDASGAPTFSGEISRSASIWNGAVSNVKLQAGSSGADFSYREGNDSRGSYASTDGHGKGYVFLDYAQNKEYDSTRVTAHETGHVLGLPDHYEGPCSELMSGGGPGPSCTNSSPDADERARVDQLWANGLKAALDRALSASR
ncbi:snapalysin [Streptomyces tropicalis]|uniref:Extracellular small neutral protease n=1 Tax=Streptomyces tropicalis TaxID=3034234 RepID=A0ABT6A3K3_9ACTN|nr:snapalysin [Streptomyces tropicalis]MDF3299231.1 snapalysin [Streptomyces tropicalis]